MTATQMLHDLGQSLWLDNITRDLLASPRWQRLAGAGAPPLYLLPVESRHP